MKKEYKEQIVGYKLSTSSRIMQFLGKALIVCWVAFTIIIISWVFLASFSTTKEIFKGELLQSGFHLDGYRIVFEKYNILKYFGNSLLYTGVTCLGLVFICAPAAYALTNFQFRGKKVLQMAYASAMGLPSVMLIAPIFMTIVAFNLNNNISTLWIIYIGIGIPACMFYLQGFFSTIPSSLQEAALVDGCSHIKAFWKVIFPLAQPGIITVTIFNFITYWNEYIWALILASNNERKTLAVALQSIIQGMGNTGNYPGLFAAVIIVFVPTFVLFILLSDVIMGDITSGGVKQ